MIDPLPTARPTELDTRGPAARWLIEKLWTRAGAGVLGGGPKLGKSHLGLEMAASVASRTACLGCFPVHDPGPAIVYLAEDALCDVRARLEALCNHRGLRLDQLDLHVITVPVLRLDLESDRRRLARTVESVRPRLVVLDPLIRLHRLNENDAGEISGLLGELRALQRTFDLALVLVHHTSKKARSHPGQSLRGSGDFWAFGDSNLYLRRLGPQLELTAEHRSAPAPEPVYLQLVSPNEDTHPHLEVQVQTHTPGPTLENDVLDAVRSAQRPLYRAALRQHLRVNNLRLGEILAALEQRGVLKRTPQGWTLAQPAVPFRVEDVGDLATHEQRLPSVALDPHLRNAPIDDGSNAQAAMDPRRGTCQAASAQDRESADPSPLHPSSRSTTHQSPAENHAQPPSRSETIPPSTPEPVKPSSSKTLDLPLS